MFLLDFRINHRRVLVGTTADSAAIVALNRFKRDRDKYIGQNEMGAQVEVSRSTDIEQDLNIEDSEWVDNATPGIDIGATLYTQTIQLPMPTNEAQSRKDHLRLLFVGNLESPWSQEDFESLDPTLDDPIEVITKREILPFKIRAIWVFDQRTGEVLKKLTAPKEDEPNPLSVR